MIERQTDPALQRITQRLVSFGQRWPVWQLLLLTSYALLAWYRFALTTGAFRNSDDSGNFLAGVEMAEGNWRLTGWVMAPDNYYPTDVLGQAALRLLFGYHPIFMMLWEGLVWGGVAWLGVWLACARQPARVLPGIICVALAMLAFNIFDHAFSDVFMSSIASHGCTILLALAAMALAGLASRSGSHWLAALGTVVTAGCFSDPVFNVIACLPILAITFLNLGDSAIWRRAIWCIGVTLSGMLLARLLVAGLAGAGGFKSVHLVVALASFSEFQTHLGFAAESIPRLLGANFFGRVLGQSPTDGPYIQLLRTPLVLAFLLALSSTLLGIWRRTRLWPARPVQIETTDLDQMLALSAAFCIASVCMTTVIEDQSCARFFLPAVVTGSVLTARLLGRVKLIALYAAFVLPVSAASGVMTLPRHETPRSTIAIPQIRQIVEALRGRSLQHGYSGYWESTIVTALVRREITSLPLSKGADGQLHRFHWLTNLDWYARAAKDWRGPVFFIAASRPGGLELSEADGQRQFGTPRDRIDLGQFVIDVFDTSDPGYQAPVD